MGRGNSLGRSFMDDKLSAVLRVYFEEPHLILARILRLAESHSKKIRLLRDESSLIQQSI